MKQHTAFRLHPETLDMLKAMAAAEDRSATNMLEQIIRRAFAGKEQGQ